jgi:EAL domain-containing protein (putative c-di-GMP-specific phosphodiesterase class I)
MIRTDGDPTRTCVGCAGDQLSFDITFAFQPIVDVAQGRIESYEALVRGPGGESAFEILSKVDERSRYRFDQTCRKTAIALAARLGMTTNLNLNFMPNAVYRPELCIKSTLTAARLANFPIERIVFEFLETERMNDPHHVRNILAEYRRLGFATAIDDFGAGYAGLGLLADFQPDLIKIDMKLVRDVDHNRAQQAIVGAIITMCRHLGVRVVAEGVESFGEYHWLRERGVELFQGYLFARPGFESLPVVDFARFRKARGVGAGTYSGNGASPGNA